MKKQLLYPFFAVILLTMPYVNFGQTPVLGTSSGFVLFTATGAFNTLGASTYVTGDVGTYVGAFTGFPPGTLVGQFHVADQVSAQAAADVDLAYSSFSGITCGLVLTTPLGNGQVLTPNVYCLGGQSTLNGNLILNGQGDPNALFIIKIGGAFATSTHTNVMLTNSASLCNVYWQVNGEFDLGDSSVFRGNVIVNGAVNLFEGSSLLGRCLSRAGAISLHNNVVTLGTQPSPSVIMATGPTTFFTGDSVMLSGNIGGTWSTGATTSSITVHTGGEYFVTNTTICSSATSNHILVTVNPVGTIPTMSEWGLIILGVLLVGVGAFYIVRRKKVSGNIA